MTLKKYYNANICPPYFSDQCAGIHSGEVRLVSSMDQSRVVSPHLESIAGGGGGVVAERALD